MLHEHLFERRFNGWIGHIKLSLEGRLQDQALRIPMGSDLLRY